jgi:hypothetical protein
MWSQPASKEKPAAPSAHPRLPPILFGTNLVRRAKRIPSPLMGEGEGGGGHRRRLDFDRLSPSRPSPARREGTHAPCANRVPDTIAPSPTVGKGTH